MGDLIMEVGKYYGMYRGKVLETDEEADDGMKLGRLKVIVPLVHGDNASADKLPWAWPVFPVGVSRGEKGEHCFISIPPKNSWVVVAFEGGDVNSPMWFGGAFPMGRFPPKAIIHQGQEKYPKIHLLRFPGKHTIKVVEGESFEIYAGENLEGEEPHREHETYIKFDLKNRKMEIRTSLPMTIRSKKKVEIRSPNISIRAENDENSRITLTAIDSTGKLGGFYTVTENGGEVQKPKPIASTITITPVSIRASSKHVSGFK